MLSRIALTCGCQTVSRIPPLARCSGNRVPVPIPMDFSATSPDPRRSSTLPGTPYMAAAPSSP